MLNTIDDRIVSSDPELEDRRNGVRMAPNSQPRIGTLFVGSRKVKCEVLDESAGGFLIVADKIPPTLATKPVELHVGNQQCILRVVWRREVEGQVRIGLQRLPESIVWRQQSSIFAWMLAAVMIGFGTGYVYAFRHQPGPAKQIAAFSAKVWTSLTSQSPSQSADDSQN